MSIRDLQPTHFNWRVDGSIAIISLARPERKNPLTFDSYAELRDAFRGLASDDGIKALVFASNGGNFSSGGDVHDIIGPLLTRDMKGLLSYFDEFYDAIENRGLVQREFVRGCRSVPQ